MTTESLKSPDTIEMPPNAVPRIYATRSALTIEPGRRAVFLLTTSFELVALRGFVWTRPEGPIGPTFEIPIDDAQEGKIHVEILLGTLTPEKVFQNLELPDRRLQTVRDAEGNTWMFAARVTQESLAHTPELSYEPLECAIQISFINASATPLTLPMAGLYVFCVPRAEDEDGLQGTL